MKTRRLGRLLFAAGLAAGGAFACTGIAGLEDITFERFDAGVVTSEAASDVADAGRDSSAMVKTMGFYVPGTKTFYLRYSNSAGGAELTNTRAAAPADALPFAAHRRGERDTIGYYDPDNSVFFFFAENDGANAARETVPFGAPEAGAYPMVGDWNGDGVSTVGTFISATRGFFVKNDNTPGNADVSGNFGPAVDGGEPPLALPIVGDWNGDGTDGFGIFVGGDGGGGTFYLRETASPGGADITIDVSGAPQGAIPIAGDWLGTGRDTVGYYDPERNRVHQAKRVFDDNPTTKYSISDFNEFVIGTPPAANEGVRPTSGRWLRPAQ